MKFPFPPAKFRLWIGLTAMLRLSHRFLFLLTVSGLMAQETPAPVPTAPTPTKPAQAELPALERPLEQATVFAREATEAMRVRDWKKAAEMWTEVVKLQPDRPFLWLRWA